MFDFLHNLQQGLQQYFQPAQSQVHNTIEEFFPSKSNNMRMDASVKPPTIHPTQQPTQQPVRQIPTSQEFQKGFARFGSNVPVASASPVFAEAAKQLPPTVDSLLPAIIALMESGGGQKVTGVNNAWNLSDGQKFVDYPNYQTALLGGDNNGVQSKGFIGNLLHNPAYEQFRKTGDLADFFSSYTPPGNGNPSMGELISRYQKLRQLFAK